MKKKSKTKYHTLEVDASLIVIRETIEAFSVYFNCTPEEISKKLQEIINLIDNKYMSLPECENDLEVYSEKYELTYEYAECIE